MRFFLLLAAVVALYSLTRAEPKPFQMPGTPFQLPGPFVDGTIITFFFLHVGKYPYNGREEVVIDFYNHPTNYSWKTGGVYDIPARISVMNPVNFKDGIKPVATNTKQHGLWTVYRDGERHYQRLHDNLYRYGWWRIDVIKIDSRRLSIFCQGFFSRVREFSMSLDDIQSAYIDTSFIDTRFLEITVKTGNPKLSPVWITGEDGHGAHGAVSNPLAKINTFPIGSRIDLIAMLQATGEQNLNLPSLYFSPNPVKDYGTMFFIISQSWDAYKTHGLGIHTHDPTLDFVPGIRFTECINNKPNGDLQHLQLERISQDVIRMRVMYHPASDNMGKVTCDLTIPPSMSSHMDRPFYILSDQGAIIFHIEQSIPQTLLPLSSSHPEIQA